MEAMRWIDMISTAVAADQIMRLREGGALPARKSHGTQHEGMGVSKADRRGRDRARVVFT